MLADTGFRLAETLGLPTFQAGGKRFFRRRTLIIREGRSEHVFYPIFPPNEHPGTRWRPPRPSGSGRAVGPEGISAPAGLRKAGAGRSGQSVFSRA